MPLTNGELWYRKLVDLINNAQVQHVWMAENKVSVWMAEVVY